MGDGGQAVGAQLLGLVEGRGNQCVLVTPAVFVDSGGGEHALRPDQGGQGEDHAAGLKASCQARHCSPAQEETLPRQLHEEKQKLEEGRMFQGGASGRGGGYHRSEQLVAKVECLR